MQPCTIETQRLQLVSLTRDEARAQIERLPPHERAQVSPEWLALLASSGPVDPWIHGFRVVNRLAQSAVGHCGFTGPPTDEGFVEIAYGILSEHQGQGYATEAAQALVAYALNDDRVQVVRAHTLPEPNASGKVLTKCGFRKVGEVIDPNDGPVWRWEKPRDTDR